MANKSLPKLSKRKSNSPIRFSFNEKKKSGKISSPSKTKATKNPTYLEMVKEAITDMKERNGSSLIAIAKYIENKYNVVNTFRSRLKYALKKAITDGKIVQIKKSYKLPTEKKRVVKKSPKKIVAKSPDVNLNTYSPGNLRYVRVDPTLIGLDIVQILISM